METKHILKLVLASSILLFAFSALVQAGTTGKIAGVVTDRETGERLPGVAVTIVETTMGAAADESGQYFILNVIPGVYKLKAQLIGYAPLEVDNVSVSLDLTTTINFELTSEALEMAGVTVTAERPIFEPDLTSTAHIITSAEVIHRPVINTDGIVYRTPGVVFDPIGGPINSGTQGTVIGNEGSRVTDTANPGITLRGGRPQEVVYMVDGLSITDPILAGQATNLNHFTISEVQLITSGFNAEYGNALSGIVNYVTQEGGREFSGRYQYSTDQLLDDYNLGTNEHFLTVGGPVPGTDNKLTYYLSGNLYLTNDWGPRLHKLPHHNQQTYRTQGKLVFKLTPSFTLRAGGFANRRQYERYNHSWLYNLESFDVTLEKATQVWIGATHNLSKSTFYEARLGYFTNDWSIGRRLDMNFLERTAHDMYPDDPEAAQAFIDQHKDEVWSGDWWDDYKFCVATTDASEWRRYRERRQEQNYALAIDNMFWSHYDTRDYQIRGSDVITGKVDVTSQVGFNNQVKTGGELNSYKITRHYNSLPWDAQPFIDIYEYKPLGGAFYVQDKIEFQGLVVNVGGRVDYLSKDANIWTDEMVVPARPDLEADSVGGRNTDPWGAESEDNWSFSPRLGISHPISDKMTIFFNYGHFIQQPRFLELYESLAPNLQRSNQRVGNPGLEPARNIQYELGFTRAITRDMKFNVTAYYKDIYNMTQAERIYIVPQPYDVYKNLDYANVKGAEFTLSKRPRKYLSFDLSYVLQFAEGTNSDYTDQYEFHSRDQTDPVTGLPRVFPQSVNPLDFDRRHSIVLQGDWRFPDDFKWTALRSFGINVTSEAGSGLPYTKRDYKGNRVGTTNQYRKPWTYTTDLTVDKSFYVLGREVNVFVQVFNLFDRINILNVYPATGRPDDDGLVWESVTDPGEDDTHEYWDWIKVKDTDGNGVISIEEQLVAYQNAYKAYAKDPMNYGAPRQISVGFYIAF